MRHAAAWSVFVVLVLACATLTGGAEVRLIPPPIATAASLPTCQREFHPVSSSACSHSEAAETSCPYTGPAAGDACAVAEESGARARLTEPCLNTPGDSGQQEICDGEQALQAEQYAVAQTCTGNTDQRVCADMLTRAAGTQQVISNQMAMTEACSEPVFDRDVCSDLATRVMATMLAAVPCPGYDPGQPAPSSCPPGTPRPYPPECAAGATDPRCTGN
jgi:hypothetical protein